MLFRYSSQDFDAPSLLGEGSLLNLFNKCLVEGYNTQLANSIYYFDDTGFRVEFASNHNYNVDQWVEISFAAVSAYNGIWKVKNIISPTIIEVDSGLLVPSTTPTDSTESIQVKLAPVGFEVAYDIPLTNEIVYRKSTNLIVTPSSKTMSLYVKDSLPVGYSSSGIYAEVNYSPEFEYFTSGGTPTTNRSYQSNARIVYNLGSTHDYDSVDLVNVKEWFLFASADYVTDTFGLYLFIKPHNTMNFMVYGFGVFTSYKLDDTNSLFSIFSSSNQFFNKSQFNSTKNFGVDTSVVIHRDVSGLVTEKANLISPVSVYQDNIGDSGLLINPSNSGVVYFTPILYCEVSAIRGTLPLVLVPSGNVVSSGYAFNTTDILSFNARYHNGTIALNLYDNSQPIQYDGGVG